MSMVVIGAGVSAAGAMGAAYISSEAQKSNAKRAQKQEDKQYQQSREAIDAFDPYASYMRGTQASQDAILPNMQFYHDANLGLNRFEGYGNWDYAAENSEQELDWKAQYEPQYIAQLRENDRLLNPESTGMRDSLYGYVEGGGDPDAAGMARLQRYYEITGTGPGGSGGGGGGGPSTSMLGGLRTVGSGPQLEMVGAAPTLDRYTEETPDYAHYEGAGPQLQQDTGALPQYANSTSQYMLNRFNVENTPDYERADNEASSTNRARQLLDDMIYEQLAQGGRLTNEQLDTVQQGVRSGQVARGNYLGPASQYVESVQVGQESDRRRNERMNAALGYLASDETVQDAEDRARQENNALASQTYQDRMQQLEADNAAISAQFGIDLGQLQFNNDVEARQFADRIAQMDFNNKVQVDQLTADLQRLGFNNEQDARKFADELSKIDLNNAASVNEFGMAVQRVGTNNAAKTQMFQNAVTGAGFDNNVLMTQYNAAKSAAASGAAAANRNAMNAWNAYLGGEGTQYDRMNDLSQRSGIITPYSASAGTAQGNAMTAFDPQGTGGAFLNAEQGRMNAGVNAAGGQANIPAAYTNQSNPWASAIGGVTGQFGAALQNWGNSGSSTPSNAWTTQDMNSPTYDLGIPEANFNFGEPGGPGGPMIYSSGPRG